MLRIVFQLDGKNISDASLGIMGTIMRAPMKPLRPLQPSIVLGGLRGGLNQSPIMPRDASLWYYYLPIQESTHREIFSKSY